MAQLSLSERKVALWTIGAHFEAYEKSGLLASEKCLFSTTVCDKAFIIQSLCTSQLRETPSVTIIFISSCWRYNQQISNF